MMKINHIASGSKGNCITVSDGHSTLVLDAGLPYTKLAREITFSQVAGVLITHPHKDHARAVDELVRRGAKVYLSMGTFKELGKTYGRNKNHATIPFNPTLGEILKHKQQIDIGSWAVLPFNTIHDTEEPLGFLFASHETKDKGVYIIDSGYVEYDFAGVTHYIIEANYSEELLQASGDADWLKDRIRRNHFSLKNLKVFLRTSDLSKTEEIWLVHLSDRNSNEQQFKHEIQRLTGIPAYTISDNEHKKETA